MQKKSSSPIIKLYRSYTKHLRMPIIGRMSDFVRFFEWIGRRKFIFQPSWLYCTLSLKTTRSGHIHHAKYRLLISLFRRTKEELTAWRPACSTRITWIVELICKDIQNRFTEKITYFWLLVLGARIFVCLHMKQEKYFLGANMNCLQDRTELE